MLVICKPTLDQVTFLPKVSFCKSYPNSIPSVCLNNIAFSNYVAKLSIDLKTFHERLGHTSISKLVHIPECKGLNVLPFLVNVVCYLSIINYPFKKVQT